jgi:hypothetical protein
MPGVRRIGVLIGTVEADPESRARVAAFEQALDVFGWTAGRKVLIASLWFCRSGSETQKLPQNSAARLNSTPLPPPERGLLLTIVDEACCSRSSGRSPLAAENRHQHVFSCRHEGPPWPSPDGCVSDVVQPF